MSIQSREEVLTARTRTFLRFPKQPWIRDLCVNRDDRASRLYLLNAKLMFTITVCCTDNSWVSVDTFGATSDYWSKRLEDVRRVSSLERGQAQSFFARLDHLSPWTRRNCRIGARDGVVCYHAIAVLEKEHAFLMEQPDVHPDAGYVETVNLYTNEFLHGLLRFRHQPDPSIVLGDDT